jgi:hypothetical protein
VIAMTSHIKRCGDALGKSVKQFNEFVGSLEHSVMPQARRFNVLEVEGTATELPVLEPVDVELRPLRSDGDFAEIEGATPRPSLAAPALETSTAPEFRAQDQKLNVVEQRAAE